jgi:hypothetical protein
VESDIGQGSCFAFAIPAAVARKSLITNASAG